MAKVSALTRNLQFKKRGILLVNTREIYQAPLVWGRVLYELGISPLAIRRSDKNPNITIVIFYRWDMPMSFAGEKPPRFILKRETIGSNGVYKLQRAGDQARTFH